MISLNNIAAVKAGVAIAFMLVMIFLIYNYFVTSYIMAVKQAELKEKKENIYVDRKTEKIILTIDENHKDTVPELSGDKRIFQEYQDKECHDYPEHDPFHFNCTQTIAVNGVSAELEEINSLKGVLYSDIGTKERIDAIKKLGKYRNKVSYDILLKIPFESDSEIRFEVLKQLHNLLPQLVIEYGEGIRYTFELAMSDIDESVALLAEDALEKFDDLSANLPENNEMDNNTHISDNFPY